MLQVTSTSASRASPHSACNRSSLVPVVNQGAVIAAPCFAFLCTTRREHAGRLPSTDRCCDARASALGHPLAHPRWLVNALARATPRARSPRLPGVHRASAAANT
jgi:hypothetical protein